MNICIETEYANPSAKLHFIVKLRT